MPLVINGQAIDDAVVDYEFANIKAYYERLGNVSCCERDSEFRGYARQNVIGRVLLAQEAQRTLPPSAADEVDAALEKLKQEHGGEGRFLASLGAAPDQLDIIRRDVEIELRVAQMIEQLCQREPDPTESLLRNHYERYIQHFMTTEQVRASHIMKAPTRGEKREEAYQTLRDVRRELLAGADFEQAAKAHSDKADDHIDLGFFQRGELADEFERVAFSMEIDEISPVFATPFGFHIIRLTERKPSTPKPFVDVADDVRQHFIESRRQDVVKALVDRLQTQADIRDVESSDVAAVAIPAIA